MNLPETGSILRRMLIVIPVAAGVILVTLFMPAQRLTIEGIGMLSFETTVTLSVGYEVARASPDVPVIELYTEQSETTPTTTITLTKPSGVQVGELLLLICISDDTSATSFTDNKTGWNFIGDFGDRTSDSHVGLFWKIADGTEGSSESVTQAGSDEWVAWYVRISGVDTNEADTINVVGTPTTTIGSSVTAPSVNTDVDDCLALCFCAFDGGDGNNNAPFSVSGTGWSMEDDGASGTTGYSDVCGCWGKKSMTDTQGATEVATINTDGTSDGIIGVQIAIAPPAVAVDISNLPTSKNFGLVAENSSYWSFGTAPTWPLDNTECYFTVTNNGSGAVNISIKATNFSGGVGWTLVTGVPGQNEARLTVWEDGDGEGDGIYLTTTDAAFISNLAASSSQEWELRLETGTFTDGVGKSSTVTLTATSV